MNIFTKLVPVEDIIAVLTGAPLSSQAPSQENVLLSYVWGEQIPADASDPLSIQALESLKQQLPTSLARFEILDLARLVIEARLHSSPHIDRGMIIEVLRKKFGTSLPISRESEDRRQASQVKDLMSSIVASSRLKDTTNEYEED